MPILPQGIPIAVKTCPGGSTPSTTASAPCTPSVVGKIRITLAVKSPRMPRKNLVLSHRMLRTLGKEDQTQSEIKKRYSGLLDLQTTSTASL